MNKKLIEGFASRYAAQINYTEGRQYFDTYYSTSIAYYDNSRSQVDIEMPLKAFEFLLKDVEIAESQYRQDREDAAIRAQHPSVKAAFDQYKMLLELCR